MIKIIVGGICALSLTMGISRFAYTPLLPIMQEQTSLGVASGGWLATIHYFGYFLGVLAALKTESLRSREIFYFTGLLLSVVSTFMMTIDESFLLWSLARFIAGFSGAAGIIIGAGLIMQWIMKNTNEKPQMGKFFAGAGVGIVISALGSILFNSLKFNWEEQWLAYGVIAVFLFFPAWFLRPTLIVDNYNTDRDFTNNQSTNKQTSTVPKGLYELLAMYFFAGFAFVISATFTVAIVKLNPQNEYLGNFVWLLVGLASIPSAVIWDWVESKFGMLKALCFAISFHAVALILNAFSNNLIILFLAAFLFGISNLGVISLTMTLAGRKSPNNPGKEMARLTIAFAIALVVGPSVASSLAELQGSYFISLLLSSCMLILGIFLLLLRKRDLG